MELSGSRFGQIAVGPCTRARPFDFDCAGRIPAEISSKIRRASRPSHALATRQCWSNAQSVTIDPASAHGLAQKRLQAFWPDRWLHPTTSNSVPLDHGLSLAKRP